MILSTNCLDVRLVLSFILTTADIYETAHCPDSVHSDFGSI